MPKSYSKIKKILLVLLLIVFLSFSVFQASSSNSLSVAPKHGEWTANLLTNKLNNAQVSVYFDLYSCFAGYSFYNNQNHSITAFTLLLSFSPDIQNGSSTSLKSATISIDQSPSYTFEAVFPSSTPQADSEKLNYESNICSINSPVLQTYYVSNVGISTTGFQDPFSVKNGSSAWDLSFNSIASTSTTQMYFQAKMVSPDLNINNSNVENVTISLTDSNYGSFNSFHFNFPISNFSNISTLAVSTKTIMNSPTNSPGFAFLSLITGVSVLAILQLKKKKNSNN